MAEYVGKNLYVAFKGTVLQADFRTFSDDESMDMVDTSAGVDVAKTYLTTLEDGTATLELVDQTGGTATTAAWNLCDKGAEGTLEWGPEGTASTKPRHYVNAIVKGRKANYPYADIVTLTVDFQFSGVVTDTAYSA